MTTDNLPVWVPLLAPSAELAKTVAPTDFVPAAMRNKPAAVAACILTGHEIGLGPMESLRSVHIIDGRAALAAEVLRRKVLEAGHSIWPVEMSSTKVTFSGHRRNEPDRVVTVTWTMDDARKAGLANKQNWSKYPRQMLTARATAELCRLMAPDAIAGMVAVEELDDPPVILGGEQEKPAPPRKAQRAPIDTTATPKAIQAPQEPDEPPLPPLPGEDDPAPQVGEELVSQKWVKGCFAKLNEIDADDDTRHALVLHGTNGRTHHIAEVRLTEANAVRDAIKALADGELALLFDESGVHVAPAEPDTADPFAEEATA